MVNDNRMIGREIGTNINVVLAGGLIFVSIDSMSDVRCSIQLAARKSGLSTHLIRMWQKRYGAVSPERSGTNRRLYSEAEIERLKLLRAVVRAGHRIGDVARLADEELRRLAADLPGTRNGEGAPERAARPEDAVEAAIAATRDLDADRLQQVLAHAAATLGFRGALGRFFTPFVHQVGELWRDGVLTAAHEHFASAAIRTFLLGSPRAFAGSGSAPVLIAVTPAGQLHEVGLVLAAAAASDLGWRVIFLGTSLPATEIAGAVLQHGARVVALSIVYPPDDPQVDAELRALQPLLPAGTSIVAGGRAATGYAAALREIGAITVQDLREFETVLETLRATPAP